MFQRSQEAGVARGTAPCWQVAAFLLHSPQEGSRGWGRSPMKAVDSGSLLKVIGAGLEQKGLATCAAAAAGVAAA